jgi:ABC-type Fe3+ transport system substrate-binding protein
MRFWIAGIPNTAPHPNAAKLFLVYLMSREGQDFVWEHDATDSYRVAGSKIAEVVKSYEARGVKFLDYFALADLHPEVVQYEKEMLSVLQASR